MKVKIPLPENFLSYARPNEKLLIKAYTSQRYSDHAQIVYLKKCNKAP